MNASTSRQRSLTLANLAKLRWHHIGFAALGLLFVLPFSLFWRQWPQTEFYLESISTLLALVFILCTCLSLRLWPTIPTASKCCLMLAALWWLQARLMHLPYVGQSDLMVGFWLLAALLAWAVSAWVRQLGRARMMDLVAWALLLGTGIQSVICLLQFLDVPHIGAWVLYIQPHLVVGNIGQRNNLGHYLFWGLLASAYLGARGVLKWPMAASLMGVQGLVLGLASSRTIVVYLLALVLLLGYARWVGKSWPKPFLTYLLGLIAWCLLCQLFLSDIALWFGIQLETGMDRLGNAKYQDRLYEWLKAWLIVQQKPIFGHGWGSYAYQSFLMDTHPLVANRLHANNLFIHSHNAVLQLLSEMGLVGLVAVSGSLLYCIKNLLKNPAGMENLFLLSLITISVCHSMLEYPLWYGYFFIPFMIFVALAAPETQSATQTRPLARWGIGLASVLLLFTTVSLWQHYNRVIELTTNSHLDTEQDIAKRGDQLVVLGNQFYLLQNFTDFSAIQYLRTLDIKHADELPDWALPVSKRYASYRPFASHMFKYILVQHQFGQKQQAVQNLFYLTHNYPGFLANFSQALAHNPRYADLFAIVYPQCMAYRTTHPQSSPCIADKKAAMPDIQTGSATP